MCELESKHRNDKSRTKYKRYDEAFKRQAVEHWMGGGLPGRPITSELGLNEPSLQVWQQNFKHLPAGQGAPALAARRAQEQRDILKKTLGVISAPSESDS